MSERTNDPGPAENPGNPGNPESADKVVAAAPSEPSADQTSAPTAQPARPGRFRALAGAVPLAVLASGLVGGLVGGGVVAVVAGFGDDDHRGRHHVMRFHDEGWQERGRMFHHRPGHEGPGRWESRPGPGDGPFFQQPGPSFSPSTPSPSPTS